MGAGQEQKQEQYIFPNGQKTQQKVGANTRPDNVFTEEVWTPQALREQARRKVSCKSIDSMISPHFFKFLEKINEEHETGFDLERFELNQPQNEESILSRAKQNMQGGHDLAGFEDELQSEDANLGLESKLSESMHMSRHSANVVFPKLGRSKKIKKAWNGNKKESKRPLKPNANRNGNGMRPKPREKLQLRKRTDEEYSKVVQGLTDCISFLKRHEGNFKFISNNPFNNMRKEIARAEGRLTSDRTKGVSRNAAFVVGEHKKSNEPPNFDRHFSVFLLFCSLVAKCSLVGKAEKRVVRSRQADPAQRAF